MMTTQIIDTTLEETNQISYQASGASGGSRARLWKCGGIIAVSACLLILACLFGFVYMLSHMFGNSATNTGTFAMVCLIPIAALQFLSAHFMRPVSREISIGEYLMNVFFSSVATIGAALLLAMILFAISPLIF